MLGSTELADYQALGAYSYYYHNGGGGLMANVVNGSVGIQNCTITGNSANDNGGGICFSGQNSELSILQDSVISGNSTNDGGGIFTHYALAA
jgi:Chlamydia polymorphic membrane protein (Chlamydia_PMP) repeat